jgi:hypothetical protein
MVDSRLGGFSTLRRGHGSWLGAEQGWMANAICGAPCSPRSAGLTFRCHPRCVVKVGPRYADTSPMAALG